MECSIEFENTNTKFYSGQEVKGIAKLSNDKVREILGVFLIVEGFAETQWTESDGTGDDEKTTTYGGKQQLIFSTIPLLKNEGVMTFNPGQHTFNFNFLLHPSLPSSFWNFYGKILYAVTVKVARVEKLKFDKTFGFPFDVVTFVDLNLMDANWRQPLRADVSKKFMLSSKILSMSAEISQQAFTSSQHISVAVSITNDTKVEVLNVIISLIREYTFRSTFVSTKRDFDLLIKSDQQGVKEKSKHEATYTFQVPENLIPSLNFANTTYIEAVYKIEITAKVGGMHRSPRIYLPIFIGTVPLKM